MMGSILAQHAPLIRDYPSAPPPPPAPPDPPEPPQPPLAEPITFAAVTRASLFGIIGDAISSTTLATITCADAAMTIALSEPVAGLTFSYSAGILSVAGTPTGSTRVQRVVVSYVASDGSNSVRGSTSHEITLVSASEVLTIGGIAGITGRVGLPLDVTICTPTANFDADVNCFGTTAIHGLSVAWSWNRALRSGTLSVAGTPEQTFGPNGGFSFHFIANGQTLGSGVSSCTIVQRYEAAAPAPAPSPSPPAPSPLPPPVPTPSPAPGEGPDPFADRVRVLLHFNELSGGGDPARTTVDLSGKNDAVPSQNWFNAPYCDQQVNPGLGLMQQFGRLQLGDGYSLERGRLSKMEAVIPGVDGSSQDVSAECLVRPAQVLWDALYAIGDDARFSPLVTCRRSSDGAVIWSLGIMSAVNNLGRFALIAFVVPVLYPITGGQIGGETSVTAIAQELGYGNARSLEGRMFHAAGAFGSRSGGGVGIGAWSLWRAGLYSSRLAVSAIKADSNCAIQIGGDVGAIDYVAWWKKSTTMIPFVGDIDEVRVTLDRYSSLVGLSSVAGIPADRQKIPFQNPY